MFSSIRLTYPSSTFSSPIPSSSAPSTTPAEAAPASADSSSPMLLQNGKSAAGGEQGGEDDGTTTVATTLTTSSFSLSPQQASSWLHRPLGRSTSSVCSSVSSLDEEHDEEEDGEKRRKYRLKVLNFNVFAGSPLPLFVHDRWPSTASLDGSRRLQQQVEMIRASKADVVCLQEMCSDGVERYYRNALADIYESFSDSHPPEPLAIFILYLIYLILATFLFSALHLALDQFFCPLQETPSPLMLTAALYLKSLLLVIFSIRKNCLVGFLKGNVKGSTVILWRRDRLSSTATTSKQQQSGGGGAKVMALEAKNIHTHTHTHTHAETKMGTTFFKEQQGDLLNLFRPRGFLTVELLFHGIPLCIINTHLNLGESSYRRGQVEELARHCQRLSARGSVILCGDLNATPESEEIQLLCEQTGMTDALLEKSCTEPTWTSQNPLTHGMLLEEDHRCDFVLYKEQQHQGQQLQQQQQQQQQGRSNDNYSNSSKQTRLRNRRCRIDAPLWENSWLSDHYAIVCEMCLEPVDFTTA